jgi:hypothetical protein
MLLRLTQQDDIATTTWINGTHHGVDPGVFHPESAVPFTKSGHAESTVKASGVILRFQIWPVYPWMRSSSKGWSFSTSLWGEWPRLPSTARVERAHSDRAHSASKEGTWPLPRTPSPNVLSKNSLVFPICSSISDCKCLTPACQSSLVSPTWRVRKVNSSESGGGSTKSFVLPWMNRSTD